MEKGSDLGLAIVSDTIRLCTIVNEVLEFGELIEAVIVQHQCLIHVFLLVEEKHSQTTTEKLLHALL